ncbi:MAG TPA: EamA family transporter [Polyangiaceae bacterium]
MKAKSSDGSALDAQPVPSSTARRTGLCGWLAFAAVCFFWGTSGPLIRFTVRSVAPGMLVTLRFAIAGVILYCGLWMLGRRPRLAELRQALPFGLVLAITNVLITLGFQRVEASVGSLLLGTTALTFAVVDVCWPGHAMRPSLAVWIGLVAGLLGVATLSLEPHLFEGSKWQGMLMLEVSAWTWAVGGVAQARIAQRADGDHADALTSAAWQMLIAGALVSPWLWFDGFAAVARITLAGWLGIAGLIVTASLIGFVSFIYMMQTLPAYIAGAYTYVNALVAAILSVLWLHERLSARFYVATLLVLGGIALIQRRSLPRPAKAE